MKRPYLYPESSDGLTWFEEVHIQNEQDNDVDDQDLEDTPGGWMSLPSAHLDHEHIPMEGMIPIVHYDRSFNDINHIRRLEMGRNKEVVKIRTTLIDKKEDATCEERLNQVLNQVHQEAGTVVSATLQYELPDGSTREVYVYHPWHEEKEED